MAKTKKQDPEAILNYFRNAAKQVPYPVDVYERTIDVPENELDEAQDDLMVKHLLANGFHIQSRIPDEVHKKKVYNPTMLTGARRDKESKKTIDERYIVGDRFWSKSTDNELEVVRVVNDAGAKAELKYNNLDPRLRKTNVLVSFDQLDSQLKMGNLVKWQNLIKK